MATYDQSGNVVYETIDPAIAKMRLQPDQPVPDYITSTATINGQKWGFFPKPDAYAMGKIVAAVDTLSYIPQQIEEQLTAAAHELKAQIGGIGPWVLVGVGAFIAMEMYSRMKRK